MPKVTKKSAPKIAKAKQDTAQINNDLVLSPQTLRGLLIASAIVVIIILIISLTSLRSQSVNTYEECVKASGSRMMMMYPPICVTRDGRQFTMPTGATPTPFPTLDSRNYTCPPSGYIDCMPAGGLPQSPQCDSTYLEWAQNNCPGFEGPIY
ncbi:hypothetical protein HGA91_03195 [candidate division WWE3 bacterium]|nr:hypothetical protein [candidate division WWE3 bacterium]